jgi:mannose-6-phosphate isomerase-like protein (cupin superfamily)
MSKYTKINFMDIEPGGGEESQGRFSRKFIESRELGITHWKYAPGYKHKKAHSHREQEEVYVVINGGGKMLLDDKVEELKQWDVVRVAPETIRAFEAGADGLELIIAGGQKPEGGDGVRATANWPE